MTERREVPGSTPGGSAPSFAASVGARVRVLAIMGWHPRTLGRDWLRAVPEAADTPDIVERARAAAAPPRPAGPAPEITLVPTTDELRRVLGARVHRLSREELAAWWAPDEHDRAEARRAIREAVREASGGELCDPRGRVIERVE